MFSKWTVCYPDLSIGYYQPPEMSLMPPGPQQIQATTGYLKFSRNQQSWHLLDTTRSAGSREFALLTFDHVAFLLTMLHLCRAAFSAIAMMKSKYHVEEKLIRYRKWEVAINWESLFINITADHFFFWFGVWTEGNLWPSLNFYLPHGVSEQELRYVVCAGSC